MQWINDNLHEVTDNRWSEVKLARQAVAYSSLNSRLMMQIFLVDDRKEIDALLEQRARNTQSISVLLKTIEESLDGPADRALVAAIWATRNPYVESYQRALAMLLKDGQPVAARAMMAGVVTPNLVAYHRSWEDFVAAHGARLDQAGANSQAYFQSARAMVLALLAIALALACIAALFVTRAMSGEIRGRLLA